MNRREGAAATSSATELLEKRIVELEAALQARDEFIATVGHELKNPLTPVYLHLQHLIIKLQRKNEGSVETQTILPNLETFSDRLNVFLRTLDRILDVSRINRGHIDLQPERLDLAEIVADVGQSMQREFAAGQTALRLDLTKAVGHWDRMRIEQICLNLLSNAVRYGLASPVEVTVDSTGGWATLTVSDRGMGIGPQEQERIFERFDRGSAVNSRSGGFGVGLWIVKEICDAEEASQSANDLKKFIHELQSFTTMTGCTTLLLSSNGRPTDFHPEHTMVDGVVELSDELYKARPLRHLRVRKMRGVAQVRGQHTLEITDAGMVVHRRPESRLALVPMPTPNDHQDRRLAFGIPRLDSMLNGGLPGQSATMLLGPSGAGKTILGLHFLA